MLWKSDPNIRELVRSTRFFWLSIFLLVGGIVFQNAGSKDFDEQLNVRQISNRVDKAMSLIKEDLSSVEFLMGGFDYNFLLQEHDDFIEELATGKDHSIFIFERDSMVFWSDNEIPVLKSFEENDFKEGLFFMSNTWGLCEIISDEVYDIVGIVSLQRSYPYENSFLSNDFILGSGRASKSQVMDSHVPGSVSIENSMGETIFFLLPDESGDVLSANNIIAIVFFHFAVCCNIFVDKRSLAFGSKRWKSNFWLLALLADLFLLRWLMIKFNWPAALYDTPFFSPFENGTFFFNSQGDLILSGLFILFFSYHFRQIFSLYPARLNEKGSEENPRLVDSFTAIGWIFIIMGFFGMIWLFEHILNERESLIEVYKVLTINASSLADLLFFIIVLAAFSLFIRPIICQLVCHYSPLRFILIMILTLVVVIVFSRLWGFVPRPPELVLLLLLVAVFSWSAYMGQKRLNHSYSVLVVIIGAIFLIQLFYYSNQEKEFLVKRQLLENLANEHDVIAEMLFRGIDREIVADDDLANLVLDITSSEDSIQSYLKSRYFGLYWNRYDIYANVCDSINTVNLPLENRKESCLNFFNASLEEVGRRYLETGFYYMDNFDGRINYMGKYPFYNSDSSYVSHLFISLDSRLLPQELGYPDLLISGRINRQDSLIQGYSYAKYQQGKLVSRAGNFAYSADYGNYPEVEIDRILKFPEDKHYHLVYKLNDEQTIILSSPKVRLWDHLISFSYVFVLLYLLWLIVSSFYYLPTGMNRPDRGLKQKIELVMVGVLVVSFILIGGGITYYIVRQYDKTNRNTISDNTQSVLIELSHKLNEEPYLSPQWSSEGYLTLSDLLVKFSYVFNSDINLFDPEGEILATSRQEIFDRQLVGRKMNPRAFHELNVHDQMEYIHLEKIGEMKYWSAYVPFYNRHNDLLAYLNLPYFAKQSVIRQEISTFVIAILNAYFLLIFLAVVLAVFLSNQVTKPLRLLQEKFTKMELGGVNQTVEYKKRDEIGSLVKAYNRMVDELEVSASKLAKSERETAWREMAKQIAHEIKNPLTPMKLSVQHLQRAWDDKAEDWEVYFDRVSQTLVEQIDSLSAIADEFSQFARMPQSKLKAVDIVHKIKSSIDLFELSDTGKIELSGDVEDNIRVYIDEEQLQQVFNNLLKNAFQSVPKSRKPKIRIHISQKENMAIVSVQDNGSGIDPEISEKLFQPNFTTKTSGMGLGLAISKGIIESARGKIWYHTGEGEGTTFIISLPVYQSLNVK